MTTRHENDDGRDELIEALLPPPEPDAATDITSVREPARDNPPLPLRRGGSSNGHGSVDRSGPDPPRSTTAGPGSDGDPSRCEGSGADGGDSSTGGGTSGGTHRFARFWAHSIERFGSLLLIGTIVVLWPFGWKAFREFQTLTDSTFHPLPGSPSAVAQDAFSTLYAENDWSNPMNPELVMILQSTGKNHSLTNRRSPSYPFARDFCLGLNASLSTVCFAEDPPPYTHKPPTCSPGPPWWKITDYYTLVDTDLALLAGALSTPDGRTVVLRVQYLPPPGATTSNGRRRLVASLLDSVEGYGSAYGSPEHFTVRCTGMKFFQRDLVASTRGDLARMDKVVLPLALLLVGAVLPSARVAFVWIIPLVTMISTVCVWSLVMCVVARYIQVTQFVPTIMMSLSLGMGIDYTLFLLSRYLEETTTNHRQRKDAVGRTLCRAGHVLLFSGATLVCTFLGLCFLPLQMLRSIGAGAAVSIAAALVVNLTLVPALLFSPVGDWIVRRDGGGGGAADTSPTGASGEDSDGGEDTGTPRRGTAAPSPMLTVVPHPAPSVWIRMTGHLLHPTRGALVLLAALLVLLPVVRYSPNVRSSVAFDQLLPATSPSLAAFHALGAAVGAGRLAPYRILFDARGADIGVTSREGFDVVHRVVNELMELDRDFPPPPTDPRTARGPERSGGACPPGRICHPELRPLPKAGATSYNGIAVLENHGVPHALYVSAELCGAAEPYCPLSLLHVLDEVDRAVTSPHRDATFVTAALPVDPFSDGGIRWLTAARETVRRMEEGGGLSGVEVSVQGVASIEYDAVRAVQRQFPGMLGVTALIVFALMGLFFRSVFPPLRSIVSIGLTVSFSFGAGVLVYQMGVLERTGVRALTPMAGGEICWLVPIMAFSIMVGLALDYDVFLISRVLEYRQAGYEHRTSIALGVHATGGIITAAGVIMAFAFGSLMLSSNPVLYQWSFLLTMAVLLDTFVIRTTVVPIVMGIAGSKHCWWPRQLPEAQLCFAEYQQDDVSHHGVDESDMVRSPEESSEYGPIETSGPRSP